MLRMYTCMRGVLCVTVYLLVAQEEVACHGNVCEGSSLSHQEGPCLKDLVQRTKHLLQMLLSFLGVLQQWRGSPHVRGKPLVATTLVFYSSGGVAHTLGVSH